MGQREQGSNYTEWLEKLKAKYPDAYARTTGANGWTALGGDGNGPTLTPHMSGPHYTDVSSASYSTQRLVGSFNHNTNEGKYFAPM